MMMSHCTQPSAAISARLVGKKVAGLTPATVSLWPANRGVAACTPAIRPDPSPYVDGEIQLGVLALDQEGDAVAGTRHFALEIRHAGHARSIDPEHHISRLQAGSQGGPGYILHDEPALGVQFLLFVGSERPHGQAQLAAAVLAVIAR